VEYQILKCLEAAVVGAVQEYVIRAELHDLPIEQVWEMFHRVAGGFPWGRENHESCRFQQAGQVSERGLDRRTDMLQNFAGDDEIVVGVSAGGGEP